MSKIWTNVKALALGYAIIISVYSLAKLGARLVVYAIRKK